ncbi:hypothetical protein NL676_013435 [Syzygium grande]|nr:hypothetical protein NL676_013435 [Syzygium grande]
MGEVGARSSSFTVPESPSPWKSSITKASSSGIFVFPNQKGKKKKRQSFLLHQKHEPQRLYFQASNGHASQSPADEEPLYQNSNWTHNQYK